MEVCVFGSANMSESNTYTVTGKTRQVIILVFSLGVHRLRLGLGFPFPDLCFCIILRLDLGVRVRVVLLCLLGKSRKPRSIPRSADTIDRSTGSTSNREQGFGIHK
jgi:hypothetical protein